VSVADVESFKKAVLPGVEEVAVERPFAVQAFMDFAELAEEYTQALP
jgi:hypothetical protein